MKLMDKEILDMMDSQMVKRHNREIYAERQRNGGIVMYKIHDNKLVEFFSIEDWDADDWEFQKQWSVLEFVKLDIKKRFKNFKNFFKNL